MDPNLLFLSQVDKFFDINISNVITWVAMAIALGVTWQRMNSNVATSITETKKLAERFDQQDKILELIKTEGTPASKASALVLNSRLDSHGQRLQKLEDAAMTFSGIAADVNWIKMWIQQNMKAKE